MTHPPSSPTRTSSKRNLTPSLSLLLGKYMFPFLVVTLGLNTLRTSVLPYYTNSVNSQDLCDQLLGVVTSATTTTNRQQQHQGNNLGIPASSSSSSSLICHANPYAGALQDSLDQISQKMDDWMSHLAAHQQRAAEPGMVRHTHERFFPFDANLASCQTTTCVGGKCRDDTSKIVCGLEQLTIATTTCVVYSIGGNNHWEFETDILEKTPCQVHTFDCTGPTSRFQKPNNERLHFHHVCLGTQHEDAPPKFKCGGRTTKCGETWTLLEMQQYLKHDRIDLFKIDIEGFEWNLLESWPELGDAASASIVLPMQILIEVHYQTQFSVLRLPGMGPRVDFRSPRDMVNLQAHLLRMGYVATERDDNRMCPHCTELTLVRVRCPPPAAASSQSASSSSLESSQTQLNPAVTSPDTALQQQQ